jgi:alpha-galactosidase
MVIGISEKSVRCKLVFEENTMAQTMGMKYLGIHLSSSGNIEDKVKKQITKINRVAGGLNDTVRRNKYTRKQTKSTFYKAVVTPIMTYAAEKRPDIS